MHIRTVMTSDIFVTTAHSQQAIWAAAATSVPSPPSPPQPFVGGVTSLALETATAFVTTDHMQQTLLNATEEEKESLYMALNFKYEITDVLPPPNHDDQQVLVMAFGYMLLFLFGTCGNAVIFSRIIDVLRSRPRNSIDNTVIYIGVLCVVDFCVCLSLPMTVIDQILGFWMFGTVVCKVHAIFENFGKVFSALVLTAMAFDRYAGVCHPQRKYLRKSSVALLILFGMIVYAVAALFPLLTNFTARELILFEKETAPHKITRMRIEKCTMVNVSSTNFTIFTGILFIFCFVVPLFFVDYFYSKMWLRLRRHARNFKASQIPLMRVSLLTLVMAFFYFMCWAPFWFATVYAVYLEYQGDQDGTAPPIFVYFMYFIHALPFTNSAVNWILYGMLNSQLQRKRPDLGTNSTYGQTDQNTTLMANGNTATQLTTLRNAPSLNGISANKPTSSSYDSQLLSHGCSSPPSHKSSSFCLQFSLSDAATLTRNSTSYQCQVATYDHRNGSHHYPSSRSPNLLTPRPPIPTADALPSSIQPQLYMKRRSRVDVETQTELSYRFGVTAAEGIFGTGGYDILGWPSVAAPVQRNSINSDSRDLDGVTTATTTSSLVDSSYSSTNSNNTNGYFDVKEFGVISPPPPTVVNSAPAIGAFRRRRGSRTSVEIENLLPAASVNGNSTVVYNCATTNSTTRTKTGRRSIDGSVFSGTRPHAMACGHDNVRLTLHDDDEATFL